MPEQSHPRIVSGTIEVAASPATVFAILADPRQHRRIDGSGSLRGRVRGPERLEHTGQTFGMDMRMFGMPYKIRNTVVELEQDRRIAWRHFGGHRWRYLLEPHERGTTVTEWFDYSHHPLLPRLFIELTGFPERNRAGIEGTLTKLKQAAEKDTGGDR